MKTIYVLWLYLMARVRGLRVANAALAQTPLYHTGLIITWRGFGAALSMYRDTGNKIWAVKKRTALYACPMSAEDVEYDRLEAASYEQMWLQHRSDSDE
jgi:hypothetical protein